MPLEAAADANSACPLVSVVIPTYNRLPWLCEALESVLSQDWPRVEAVVVDDGSTDGTGERVRQEYGDRVRLLVQKNSGASVARNAGLAAARGEFLALLDSDDVLPPGSIRARAESLLGHPEAGAVCGAHQRQTRDGRWVTDPLPSFLATLPRGELLARYAVKPFFYHVDLMFRRKLLPRDGALYQPGVCNNEDYLVALYILAKTTCIPCAAPAYGQRMATGRERMRYAEQQVLAQSSEPLERFLRESDVAPALQPCAPIIRAYFLVRMAKAAWRVGDGRLYRSYIGQARALHNPSARGFKFWRRYVASYLPVAWRGRTRK